MRAPARRLRSLLARLLPSPPLAEHGGTRHRAAGEPAPLAGTCTQPDGTTCGAAALVMSAMLNDRAYATFVATGHHPVNGRTSPLSPSGLFHAESLTMHRRTNGLRDHAGRLQLPWPRALGTSPWGLARQMTGDGGSGVPGAVYRVDLVDPGRPGAAFDRIVAAVRAGHNVPLYVGNAWSPRHVVLVTGGSDHGLTVYEPSAGRTVTVTRSAFERGDVDLAGWREPWLAVVPS